MNITVRRPLLLVVSAPSGAGKTTLCDRLLREFPDVVYSVSCTTRAPRAGEREGKAYAFISGEEFRRRIAQQEFLEYATVHGSLYGTPRKFITDGFSAGRDVLMDIDVQGAETIRARLENLPEENILRRGFVDVFIAPPSLEALRARLEKRGTDAQEVIERRLKQAGQEISQASNYQYQIVNDDIDRAYDAFRAILVAERHRRL